MVGSEGQHLAQTVTSQFTVAPGSTLRLQQLLAELGYLPLTFTPASPLTSPTQEGNDQVGSFTWRWPNQPLSLLTLWTPGTNNVITQGAVMNFESQNGLKTDGVAGPEVWSDLLADVQSGHGDALPWDYVVVSQSLPESATVYKDGVPVYTTPVNTGVAGSGHGERHLARLRPLHRDDHDGHQPRRLTLRGPGHPLGELLPRRRRAARLRARLLRVPTERRVRRDAAGQRRGRLPADAARNPGHGPGVGPGARGRPPRRPSLCTRCRHYAGSSTSVGRVLIGAGVLLLLFTAYQIWGTSIQESHTQSDLRSQLQTETGSAEIRRALDEAVALDKLPTGPPVTAPRTEDPPEGDPIGDIRIPVIGIDQVVVEGTNTPDLRKGPGHYTGTPLPGQGGNAAIAGHRTTYGHPFYNLDSVKVGDPIVLTTLQGIFVYDTTKSIVVSPSDTDVIKNVFADVLTLTTCNPALQRVDPTGRPGQARPLAALPQPGLPAATLHADPKSQNLAGDSNVELTDALFWGFVTLAVGAGIFYAAYRFRRQRWVIYGVGAVGVLVLLWFFFGAVSPLLPASF